MVAVLSSSSSSAASDRASSSSSSASVHVVAYGETLAAIAKASGVSVSALLTANPRIANPDRIYPGDRIEIPEAGVTSGADSIDTASAPNGAGANALSEHGLEKIKGFEGLRLTAYQDSAKVWTIGYGHTGGVRPGDQITQAQADAHLRADVGWAQAAVRTHVKVPLSQGQFDALTSFTFNLGAGALKDSTLLNKLNAGDYAGAQAQFGRWVYADDQVLQGLVDRRAAEAVMFGGQAPSGDDTSRATATTDAETTSAPSSIATDTVQRGDTLFAMAREHGVSLQALIAANPQIANPNLIHAGQTVNLPGGASIDAVEQAAGPYTVRGGDTLTDIAQRHGVSLQTLVAANPQIANPNLIHPGQQVQLPQGAASVSGSTGSSSSAVAVDGGASLAGGKTVQGYIRGQASTIEVVPVGQGEYLRADAAQAYLAMQKDAAAAGFHLTATSGFRSNEEQQVLYQRHLNGTGNLAARPGFSNHQGGISIDIGGSLAGYDSAAFAWLEAHAAEYGFVNDVGGEWWHWTFKP